MPRDGSRLALGGLLPARRAVVLALLDRGGDQLAHAGGICLRAALELRRSASDETAGRAVTTAVEASVAVRAVHLERCLRFEETELLRLGDERLGVGHADPRTTDFFSV